MLLGAAVVVAAAVLVPKLVACGQAAWYRRVRYPRLRRRMDRLDRPPVRIFVPCHGMTGELAGNLDAIAGQEYEPFDVVCVTGAADDPAAEAIEQARARHPGVFRRVVAGPATSCSQKNHNLLAAIRRHRDAEVYLFCDAKVRPRRDWVARMVEPFTLQRPPVVVSALCSGGRYRGWSLPHVLQQQVACWQSVSLMTFVGGVWGASMALRRADFDRLGVEELWSTTIVDDTTLFQRLIAEEGRPAMFASLDARPEPGYAMEGTGGFLEWGVRQLQYVHRCLPRYRLPMLLRNLGSLLGLAWPPALALAPPGTEWHAAGMVSLGLFAADAVVNLAAKPITALPLPWRWHLLAAPFWEAQWAALSIAAALRRTVVWHGVHYRVDRRGRVTGIRS